MEVSIYKKYWLKMLIENKCSLIYLHHSLYPYKHHKRILLPSLTIGKRGSYLNCLFGRYCKKLSPKIIKIKLKTYQIRCFSLKELKTGPRHLNKDFRAREKFLKKIQPKGFLLLAIALSYRS
jgi:hypothetical protein